MRLPLCIRLTGLMLLGGLVLCPSKVCGQASSAPSLSISNTLSFSVPISARQSIVFSTELMRVESLPKPLAEQLYARPAWRYKAVPLTVGFSYALTNPNRRIVPVVGVGVSAYFSQAKQLAAGPGSMTMLHSGEAFQEISPRLDYHKGLGVGYGVEATLGLRADLNRHFYALAQGRARYVDGLAFTAHDYDFRSKFTKIDFALGFGVKF